MCEHVYLVSLQIHRVLSFITTGLNPFCAEIYRRKVFKPKYSELLTVISYISQDAGPVLFCIGTCG